MRDIVLDYLSGIEDVLAWLLGADETLSDFEDDSLLESDVETVKQLFHAHEDFMLELTDYQSKIGDLLSEGQVLIDSNLCSSDERKEVKCQRELLNKKWEVLRCKAVEKQTNLHHTLMLLQQKQLDNLRAWLITAEDRISTFLEIGSTLELVLHQCENHKTLQEEVQEQQVIVNSLSNMVVIIDDAGNTSQPSEGVSDDLEDQLLALGEKWAHVCRFVEERGAVLELVARNWKLLEEEEVRFRNWISKLDKRLTGMEESAEETEPSSQFVSELIKRLQRIEKEMEGQHVYYSKIADEGQKLLEHIDESSAAATEIENKLKRLTETWDETVQRMENLGNALTKATSMVESSEGDALANGAKKRRLDSWKIKEWQKALEKVSEWLSQIESDLGIDDQDDANIIWDQLAPDEQQLLVEDSENLMSSKNKEVEELFAQGKQIIDDLNSLGENVDNVEEIITSVEERWQEVSDIIAERKVTLQSSKELKRLRCELEAIKRVLSSHKKWQSDLKVDNAKNINDITNILDQSKVRVKSVATQQDRIGKIKEESVGIADTVTENKDLQSELQSASNDIKDILTSFDFTTKLCTTRIESLKKAKDELDNYGRSKAELVKWLEENKQLRVDLNLILDHDGDLAVIKQRIELYYSIYQQIESRTVELEKLKVGCAAIDGEEQKMSSLYQKYMDSSKFCLEVKNKLEDDYIQVQDYYEKLHIVEEWLNGTHLPAVHSISQATNIDEYIQLLDNDSKAIHEIESYEQRILELEQAGSLIINDHGCSKDKISRQLAHVRSLYSSLIDRCNKISEHLRFVKEKYASYINKMANDEQVSVKLIDINEEHDSSNNIEQSSQTQLTGGSEDNDVEVCKTWDCMFKLLIQQLLGCTSYLDLEAFGRRGIQV